MDKVADFFLFIFELILSLIGIMFSDTDYKSYTVEEQTAFIEEYEDEFEDIIDLAFELTEDSDLVLTSTTFALIDKESDYNLKKIRQRFKDGVTVAYYDEGEYVRFDLTGRTPGFGDCKWFYFVDEPNINIFYDYEIKEEDGKDTYCLYNPANYTEYIQVDDHWYFCQTAYNGYEGFKRKE